MIDNFNTNLYVKIRGFLITSWDNLATNQACKLNDLVSNPNLATNKMFACYNF